MSQAFHRGGANFDGGNSPGAPSPCTKKKSKNDFDKYLVGHNYWSDKISSHFLKT